jgi:hypothetical protein
MILYKKDLPFPEDAEDRKVAENKRNLLAK